MKRVYMEGLGLDMFSLVWGSMALASLRYDSQGQSFGRAALRCDRETAL